MSKRKRFVLDIKVDDRVIQASLFLKIWIQTLNIFVIKNNQLSPIESELKEPGNVTCKLAFGWGYENSTSSFLLQVGNLYPRIISNLSYYQLVISMDCEQTGKTADLNRHWSQLQHLRKKIEVLQDSCLHVRSSCLLCCNDESLTSVFFLSPESIPSSRELDHSVLNGTN